MKKQNNDIDFLEPINLNLCNTLDCGIGTCVVTSRNLTFCQCPSGITGTYCDQRMFKLTKLFIKIIKYSSSSSHSMQ